MHSWKGALGIISWNSFKLSFASSQGVPFFSIEEDHDERESQRVSGLGGTRPHSAYGYPAFMCFTVCSDISCENSILWIKKNVIVEFRI